MFLSRRLNNKISKLHERFLRRTCSDKTLFFEQFLETDNSVSMQYPNIGVFGTELCKIVHMLSTDLVKEVFPFNENTT